VEISDENRQKVRYSQIPKDVLKNRARRYQILTTCESSEEAQLDLLWLCSRPCVGSMLYWINMVAFTHVVKEVDASGQEVMVSGSESKRPFVTWPVQDAAAIDLYNAITTPGNKAIVWDKSRELGASWLALAVCLWFWQFRPDTHFLLLSRKEELVDNGEDPKSLFYKLRYMLRNQPSYLLPKVGENHRKLMNEENGSSIVGDTTTAEVGHGGRVTLALCDEAARMERFGDIWGGLQDTAHVRLAVSTAKGWNSFAELKRSGRAKLYPLAWWDHPQKGRGRTMGVHPYTGRAAIVSPWYLEYCKTASPRDVAQNLDMDDAAAGQAIFDAPVVYRHIAATASPPWFMGTLKLTEGGHKELAIERRKVERIAWVEREPGPNSRGTWELWCDLVGDELGQVRPWQHATYVMGIDIGAGTGDSESVISVLHVESKTKVGQFRSTVHSPDQLALMACAAGYWFGGRRGYALLVPERNGGWGKRFINRCRKLKYPWIFRNVLEDQDNLKKRERYGWLSTREAKAELLESYRGAMARDDYLNSSEDALKQCMEYVYYESGGVGPGAREDQTEESRKRHGDIVIADALAVLGAEHAPRIKPTELRFAEGTLGAIVTKMKKGVTAKDVLGRKR